MIIVIIIVIRRHLLNVITFVATNEYIDRHQLKQNIEKTYKKNEEKHKIETK